jgi:hypothetical protein
MEKVPAVRQVGSGHEQQASIDFLISVYTKNDALIIIILFNYNML